MNFVDELIELINKYSKENDSDTPDFILAGYIEYCLLAFTTATKLRDNWYRFKPFKKIITDGTVVSEK